MWSVTDEAAPKPRSARRTGARAAPALAALALVLALTACGSQKSALPPPPDAAGTVALSQLARHPEVYADATLAAVGTVVRAGRAHPVLYALAGGHGTRIVLEPTASAARYLGRRVRVSGIFTVTFKLGYEILISKVSATATL
jgi:hypothetical protein